MPADICLDCGRYLVLGRCPACDAEDADLGEALRHLRQLLEILHSHRLVDALQDNEQWRDAIDRAGQFLECA